MVGEPPKRKHVRVPDEEAREIWKTIQEPWLPPGGDYEVVEPHPAREAVTEVLGIEESLVRPIKPTTTGTTTTKTLVSLLPGGGGGRKRRSLDELKLADGTWWRPVRPTSRTVWPATEISMAWYTQNYNALYLRTKEFVREYFGIRNINPTESPWLGMPKSLRKYVALIARQDNAPGRGWDYMLSDTQMRQFVVTGVIARVFDKFIWQDLLFGATEAQRDALEKQDKLTAELDGYPRTAIRADNIRALMGGDLETPLFWEKVDELTMQLIRLLLPLIRLMDVSFEKSRAQSLRVIYQELYYLVFQAALLSLGIRWSHDIFRFSWPVPGLPFEKEQENIDANVFEMSNRRARTATKSDEVDSPAKQAENPKRTPDKDTRLVGRLTKTAVRLKDGIQSKVISIAMAGQDAASVQARRNMILPPDQLNLHTRMAKVYVVTWPALFRHEIVGERPKHPVTGYLDTEGERITVIMKSPVVYYSGLDGPQGEYHERIPSLEEHVLFKRRERFWKTLWRWAVVATLVTIGWVTLTLTAVFFFPSLGALIHNINYFVGGTIKMVVRQAALWFLTVLNNLARFMVGGWKVLRFFSYARQRAMDASALLKSQGWRGKGFSLHPSNNNIGLSKPILIARNTDGRGVGQKPHVTSDTWWLDAFDQKLKGLDTSKKGTVTQSVSNGKLDVIVTTGKNGKYTGASGLYASFVSGGMLQGTLQFTSESTSSRSTTDATPISSSSEDDSVSGKMSKKANKESRKGETKLERKMRREARRLRKATKKEAKKAAKTEAKRALKESETKEERRARRIERRARKEAKRSKRGQEAGQPKG
ncbi:hypothetical protein V8F33_000384 [Rhypophila sp. PSN 637]